MVHPAQLKQPLYAFLTRHSGIGCGIRRIRLCVAPELMDNTLHGSIVAKSLAEARVYTATACGISRLYLQPSATHCRNAPALRYFSTR